MPDWIIWLVVGFIVYRFCVAGSGAGCGRRISSSRHYHRESAGALAGDHGTPVAMRCGSGTRSAGRHREAPIQAAQRRFVQGTTTVEEYEAELDRVLRERSVLHGDAMTQTAPRTSRV